MHNKIPGTGKRWCAERLDDKKLVNFLEESQALNELGWTKKEDIFQVVVRELVDTITTACDVSMPRKRDNKTDRKPKY